MVRANAKRVASAKSGTSGGMRNLGVIGVTVILASASIFQPARCLRLTKLTVPSYRIRGEMALLECGHELEGDRLYSVKWYKDNEEFYRYVPRATPPQHSYKVDGVRVDHHQSDSTKVYLRSVTLKSRGVYRCEVSAEAPSFSSASGERKMEVVFLPKEGPKILGEDKSYQTGETIDLNCTASKSYPPATLRWYVNDRQADPTWVIPRDPASHGPHGLTGSALGLQFQVQPHHFLPAAQGGGSRGGAESGPGRIMRIRCVATISAYFWEGDMERSVVESRQQLQGGATATERMHPSPSDEASDSPQASAAHSSVIDNREALLLVRGNCGHLSAPGLLTCLLVTASAVAAASSLTLPLATRVRSKQRATSRT